MAVVVETTLGDLAVELFIEERPLSCLNFLKLCKMKYYNLCLFHSVNANFCAQTGDPSGKGDGGESIHGILKGPEYRFYQGEVQPKLKHDRLGLVSMASHGNGMFGSQFIITLSADLGSLDGEHCVFGQIVEGSDVLLKLNEAITDDQNRPYQDIRITHTVILEDPFPDPAGLSDPPASPLPPSTKDVAYSRIPADEPLKDKCTQEELDEMVQAREAAARATILEMVGDLPDADVAPPENVLFVCKLNPVTTDHDLSIIFSRFGKVKSCEVIRDNVTGDSLQYAFVEFEEQKSCEEAYFKMDNVLIDDRRIHVDFSQSVAKWRGKGKGVELLIPGHPAGWGNKRRNFKNNQRQENNNSRRDISSGKNSNETREKKEKITKTVLSNEGERKKNGKLQDVKNKINRKTEPTKKRKRASPSSSSSETSDTTSSSDTSESEPVRKKSRRRTKKVVLVVKAPRSKKKRVHNKYSDSSDYDQSRKKKKKSHYRSSSSDSSSDERVKSKRKRKSLESEKKKIKKSSKRKKESEESSDSDESNLSIKLKKLKKSIKKKRKEANYSCSSDFESKKSKGKKSKTKNLKKRNCRQSSDRSSSYD